MPKGHPVVDHEFLCVDPTLGSSAEDSGPWPF